MRHQDAQPLETPYDLSADLDIQFATALGVDVPAAWQLSRDIFADLDEAGQGIGWWAPHPGRSRRILISDHLVQCARSIPVNLIEARLHLLEATDQWERQSDALADAVQLDAAGGLSVSIGRTRIRPRDDLPRAMTDLHVAGFFRAILSALDCLGAVIVGVAALPTSLLHADLARARRALAQTSASAQGQKLGLYASLAASLEAIIASSGPPGWLVWTSDFRHMVVHRARRLQSVQLRPRQPMIYGPDGGLVLRTDAVVHLPRDPGRSDVEVLLSTGLASVLTENAGQTIAGVLRSAVTLIDATAAELVTCWAQRRTNPALLTQPRDQWPAGPSTDSTGFPGYAPGSLPYDPTDTVSDPSTLRRLRASALLDDIRGLWTSFD